MEYIEGEMLSTRLQKGALSTIELLRYSIQISDALDKAHRKGIVHAILKEEPKLKTCLAKDPEDRWQSAHDSVEHSFRGVRISAAGLPDGHIPLALALFSAGVEIGHFSFVAVVFGLLAAIRHQPLRPPIWAWRVPPYAIGGAAAF